MALRLYDSAVEHVENVSFNDVAFTWQPNEVSNMGLKISYLMGFWFNVYEFLERWIHAFIAELSDRFCQFPVFMFVHI